jgi:hypothetical protein
MRRRAVGQTSFGCVVKDDETADNVSMIAAGAAFFGPPRALLLAGPVD